MTNIAESKELARRFTLPELRHELRHAENNCLPDWDDYTYWLWYIDVVKGAISLKLASQPKPKAIPGHIDLQAVRDRADIVAIAESYGIRLQKSGRRFKALCPFHSEKTASFYIYPDEKRWYCFGACSTGGDVINFVMKIEGIDFKTACQKVGDI